MKLKKLFFLFILEVEISHQSYYAEDAVRDHENPEDKVIEMGPNAIRNLCQLNLWGMVFIEEDIVEIEHKVILSREIGNSALKEHRPKSRHLRHVPTEEPSVGDIQEVIITFFNVAVVLLIDDIAAVDGDFRAFRTFIRDCLQRELAQVVVKSRFKTARRNLALAFVLFDPFNDLWVGIGEVQDSHHFLVVSVGGHRIAVVGVGLVVSFLEDVSVRSTFCVDEVTSHHMLVVQVEIALAWEVHRAFL